MTDTALTPLKSAPEMLDTYVDEEALASKSQEDDFLDLRDSDMDPEDIADPDVRSAYISWLNNNPPTTTKEGA